MLRWNTFSHHHHSTNKRLCALARKKAKCERTWNWRRNSCWRTCLFTQSEYYQGVFFFLAPPSTYTHTQKLSRKTICFIFRSCSLSPFPLHLSFPCSLCRRRRRRPRRPPFTIITNARRSFVFYALSFSLSLPLFVFMICIWVNVSNFAFSSCVYISVLVRQRSKQ